MDKPFEYGSFVTGRNFFGRREDCAALGGLLENSRSVAIYEAPKSGKTSLVEQTFLNLNRKGVALKVIRVNLLTVRSLRDFLERLCSGLADAGLENPRETEDVAEILTLPWKLAASTGLKVVVFLSEFQNLDFIEDSYRLYKTFEKTIAEHGTEGGACYILSGSKVNAMKEIFEHHKFFWRCTERFKLSRVEDSDIVDHVVRGFLSSGKVIENELLLEVCRTFDNNLWYINHFISICDMLTRGYILQPVVKEAMSMLLAVHEPRFISIMNDLTTYQVSLLRAILDGQTHFSSAEIIRQYNLNSSANVKRLREALCKKEIITFEDGDRPCFLDPLFKYWVERYFFGTFAI